MKNKSLLAVLITVLSSPAMANFCDFKNIDGLEFEVGTVNKLTKFNNYAENKSRDSYEFLMREDSKTPLSQSFAYGRNLKVTDSINFDYLYSTDKENIKNKIKSRSYNAVLDSCEKIKIVVPETHASFKRYFNVNDHSLDGSFPFIQEQATLGLIFLSDMSKVEKHVGKNVYVLNYKNSKFVGMLNNDPNILLDIDGLTPYKLKSVDYDYVSLPGFKSGQFGMILEIDGRDLRVPFIKDRISLYNPFNSKKINKNNVDNIKEGKLKYGMNMHEVLLSLGQPDYVRDHKTLRNTHLGSEYEKSDYFPYGGLSQDHPFGFDVEVKGNQSWFYADKFGEGRNITFDKSGILKEGNQESYVNKSWGVYAPLVTK